MNIFDTKEMHRWWILQVEVTAEARGRVVALVVVFLLFRSTL